MLTEIATWDDRLLAQQFKDLSLLGLEWTRLWRRACLPASASANPANPANRQQHQGFSTSMAPDQ
jgi:hypothetical protein